LEHHNTLNHPNLDNNNSQEIYIGKFISRMINRYKNTSTGGDFLNAKFFAAYQFP